MSRYKPRHVCTSLTTLCTYPTPNNPPLPPPLWLLPSLTHLSWSAMQHNHYNYQNRHMVIETKQEAFWKRIMVRLMRILPPCHLLWAGIQKIQQAFDSKRDQKLHKAWYAFRQQQIWGILRLFASIQPKHTASEHLFSKCRLLQQKQQFVNNLHYFKYHLG